MTGDEASADRLRAGTWAALFDDLPREHGFEPLRVEGVLPAELDGTLYRCGPARRACAGRPYRHVFDGDGAVSAVRIARGAAWGAARMIETPGFIAERRAQQALYPAYGTLPPGRRQTLPRPKNAANISVLAWNDRLFALHESGPPTEFEADGLRTLGEHELGLPATRRGFSAHPHEVRSRGTLFNFAVAYGATTRLHVFEVRGDTARPFATVALSGPTMIHDFAATERHLVFFAPPLRLELDAFVAGRKAYGDALAWQPEHGTEVVVVPLDDPARAVRFTVEPWFQWHLAGGFERGREIVVDLVRYAAFAGDPWMGSRGPGHLARATIDPTARALRIDDLSDASIEFPTIATPGVIHACAHGPDDDARSGPHDQIARIDAEAGQLQTISLGAGTYPSEPILAAGRWLLVLVFDAHRRTSHLAVLDADRLDDGPVARAWFDHHIPYTFHGTWVHAR